MFLLKYRVKLQLIVNNIDNVMYAPVVNLLMIWLYG